MENGEYVYISRDISSLGSAGILMHSIHLFDTHFKLFLSILLLIITPTMIPWDKILFFKQTYASLINAMDNSTAAAEIKPPGLAEGASIDFNFGHFLELAGAAQTNNTVQMGARWKSQFQDDPSATVRALWGFIGGILLSVALSTIRRSFVTYSVGRIQVGKRATIVDAWHAFRVLWKRVLWTGVCEKIVWLAAMALMYSPVVFFNQNGDANNLLHQLLPVTYLFSLTIRLCSAFAFQLATVVAVVDEACGWKAFGRSWRLLKRRKRVAAGIAILSKIAFLLSMVICMLVALAVYVVYWLTSGLRQGKLYMPILQTIQREFAILILVAYPLADSMIELLTETLFAVFCISCMAFHQENISKSAFFQKLTRIGGDHDA